MSFPDQKVRASSKVGNTFSDTHQGGPSTSFPQPILLIPDDGSQVVVSREEWGRQCGRIEDTMKALEGYDNGDSPHATVAMIRAHILGTEGGGDK